MRRNLVFGLIGAVLIALVAMTIPSSAGAATRLKKPGAPTALSVTAVNTAIAASWSPPVSNGGSAVIYYVAIVGKGKNQHPCVSTGPTSCIATGLSNGRSYRVQVRAVNVRGHGPAATSFGVPNTLQNCSYFGEYANLQNCTALNLSYDNLANANLTGINLTGGSLLGSNLTDANLTNANLTDVSLYYTNLTGANLTGANLTGVGAK